MNNSKHEPVVENGGKKTEKLKEAAAAVGAAAATTRTTRTKNRNMGNANSATTSNLHQHLRSHENNVNNDE